ncbi:DUF4349 domain-containing protein [Amycolatopsis sp. H20-H5]|uniref:DUF4349 domain-containing protein n=1 Tax=Amycolatopsis sp. H20-H5 TaxID=3046309 RepID=UPI002DBC2AB3|nr:DUF4349 domain-containing protein [Amycolatopsis sp. H20-H5]MEC3975363.1 DUF4349 domain-containing protein [Amycolatopsis sp. H20-H5]
MTRVRRPLALAGVAAVLVLAGCSGNQGAPSASSEGYAGQAVPAQQPNAGKTAQGPAQGQGQTGKPADANAGVPAAQPGVTDRKLARSARLDLTAPDVSGAVSRAHDIAVGVGGYTGQEHVVPATATISLTVPAERLDSALDQLAKLGTPTTRELTTQDVTEQVVDVDSRLATQRASVERMRALLAKANSVSEVASVESELTTREADLESLQSRRNALAGSVSMATIAMTVTAPPATPAPPEVSGGGFFGGLGNGWAAFLAFGGGLLTVLGAVLPFAALFGVPAYAVWWALRRRRQLAPAVPEGPEAVVE